ncbi:hypothetical protein J2Z83_003923 [Virgibacillus natechei]|uniref:Uncharacterized protein n=1 Tax=Virgibacillus natechei TaxID=1216297 RepID=A0ABS4ILJ3_9BACI|nr:hypothetical protein [Virgibacillus natechei]MBP1971768.1 hypothetical protein [Virgibacillus natechei]UZD11473.1 hypothetical protein OLD84_10895 [Virgibacillus natechei]
MRYIIIFATAITAVSMLYKWRYRLMNAVLAISFLRRIAISLSMNMPAIRAKILPSLFNGESSHTSS